MTCSEARKGAERDEGRFLATKFLISYVQILRLYTWIPHCRHEVVVCRALRQMYTS
jgi:hypothetical protein